MSGGVEERAVKQRETAQIMTFPELMEVEMSLCTM